MEYNISIYDMNQITNLMPLVLSRQYPGDDRKKPNGRPVWNMRTSFLYYNMKFISEAFIWDTLSMGHVGNGAAIVSDKLLSVQSWKTLSPVVYENELKPYSPKLWHTIEEFENDIIDPEGISVFKPENGQAAHGIMFKKNSEMIDFLKRETHSRWVIQEFVKPFLFLNRKTHFRVMSLLIVQPDYSRQYYIYKNMRMFIAEDEYDENRLLIDGEDLYFMLCTNMNISHEKYLADTRNDPDLFDIPRYMKDAKTAINEREVQDTATFDEMYDSIHDLHSALYKTMGHLVECVPTDISIYGNACYHLIGSDIAINSNGEAKLLEMNMNQGIKRIWSKAEITEFTNGASALIRTPHSPYANDKTRLLTDNWGKLDI